MKPTISIALITLGLTFPAPALAALTHLTCTETKSNEGKRWTQQVLIDADRGYAKADSTEMGLVARPTELALEVIEEGKRGIDFLMHQIFIGRQTLAFKRRFSFRSSGEWTEREASGQCRITPAPAGRQI